MKLKEDYFTKLLNLENGTPSHDCLSDLYASIDPKQFMKIFIEWTKDILEKKTGKKISIDGKAIKSATDKINNGNIPYIVSAFILQRCYNGFLNEGNGFVYASCCNIDSAFLRVLSDCKAAE